jgi:hypothetical protein
LAILILLRLSESQQLYDAVNDPTLRLSLEVFFNKKRDELLAQLVSAVRRPMRDTMKEARLAGQAESYEEALGEMQRFAEEQLKENCK